MRLVSSILVGLVLTLPMSMGCSSSDDGTVDVNDPPPDGPCSDNTGNRFVDCGNGTVTDTTTGLIWLKNANCVGMTDWDTAHGVVTSVGGFLHHGICGLTDHSSAGDWRLPSLQCPSGMTCELTAPPEGEFATILAPACGAPYIPNTAGTGCWTEGGPFTGVQSNFYWSSTAYPVGPNSHWGADLAVGLAYGESNVGFVWPVRGGQP